MNKAMLYFMCFLFSLIILFPIGVLISSCLGYTFELISISAFSIAIAVLSVCVVIFCIGSKETIQNKTFSVLSALLPLFSLINGVLYIVVDSSFLVIICTFVTMFCSFFLATKYGKPFILKFISLVISALLVWPVISFSFVAFIFGNFGVNAVVQTVESPSGKYYAEVIDSDQGALGGDTFVDVYEKSIINVFIFEIHKKPQRVYYGEWGEFENMKIFWEDDDCLVINSEEYKIE